MQLSDTAQRVLGALIEKAMATPQAYPLSTNALRAACNQTTGRDPITHYDDDDVGEGVRELSGQSLVRAAYARRSSTPKYEHRLDAHLEVDAPSAAVLGVMLLRGPQTVGELRLRTERLHHFAELGEVQEVLEALAGHRFGALVEELPRQPGRKETRWRHLLGGEAPDDDGEATSGHGTVDEEARAEAVQLRVVLTELQAEITGLREELERIRRFVGA